ncbi:helix-turn-helix domain-containing protein [Flavobacterium sp. Fl-77]|uniref:Helix-turn-helix domain-containing protein n=1 Tax=Flavobacterium flavipigmentatum TaxID=2893884 RepID=A0AAJ2VXP5_9FLAO|nr:MULTISPECIES: helix-turn-helix domain-containing protein [unclassified Flavobacterium]MDX6181446.1 helix-turn-helix domain-containing protein [Flavobacterium sp. Fl-33]MDX6185520.1 helix-turn-helix domain-containing protein [Flavobacterium sp. Fl-77]UFH37623.1 helix-turn-helix domain-containing protein [Flavobacterium sp. F-70]
MNDQTVSPLSDFNASDLKLKGFKVYKISDDVSKIPSYNRRDFYKICINTSQSLIHYADRGIEVNGTILFFGNPHIPYSWEAISPYEGYACVFTEEFLKVNDRSESLHQSPLFKIGGTPIFNLSPDQKAFIDTLFEKMIAEQETDYVFKDDLLRNYINLILHESMKMQPSENFFKHKNASARITSLFLELLERQFPIEAKDSPLMLKTPQDYAQSLAVHVNHLNRSVKEITGKSTTAHISERIIGEAKALLQHTNWSIADIGYSLGFEYPSYFNNYFKRLTGTVPKSLRM